MSQGKITCASCGTKAFETKGSLKHPVCLACWETVFDDDEGKYYRFLVSVREAI